MGHQQIGYNQQSLAMMGQNQGSWDQPSLPQPIPISLPKKAAKPKPPKGQPRSLLDLAEADIKPKSLLDLAEADSSLPPSLQQALQQGQTSKVPGGKVPKPKGEPKSLLDQDLSLPPLLQQSLTNQKQGKKEPKPLDEWLREGQESG